MPTVPGLGKCKRVKRLKSGKKSYYECGAASVGKPRRKRKTTRRKRRR